MTGQEAQAAADLTDLAVWIREQLGGKTAVMRQALEEAAAGSGEIAERLAAGTQNAEPERDPDLEQWVRRQLDRARPQAADDSDLDAIRKLAAMEDGTVAETVARWLREVREANR